MLVLVSVSACVRLRERVAVRMCVRERERKRSVWFLSQIICQILMFYQFLTVISNCYFHFSEKKKRVSNEYATVLILSVSLLSLSLSTNVHITSPNNQAIVSGFYFLRTTRNCKEITLQSSATSLWQKAAQVSVSLISLLCIRI